MDANTTHQEPEGLSHELVDAAIQSTEETSLRTIATQTELAYTASKQPLEYIAEGWFSFDMLDKILQMPHYKDFTPT